MEIPTHCREHIGEIIDLVAERLGTCCRVQRLSSATGVPYLVAKKNAGKEKKKLWLPIHLDTVDPEQHHWRRSGGRLQYSRSGGRIYGRGVWDMKAGAEAVMEAVESTDPPADLEVSVIVSTDEEGDDATTLAQIDRVKGGEDDPPDFILGTEISTHQDPRQGARRRKRIVASRVGHAKYKFDIRTEGHHGSFQSYNFLLENHEPLDALGAINLLRQHFQARFSDWSYKRRSGFGLSHELLLGTEGSFSPGGNFLSLSKKAVLYASHLTAYPLTTRESGKVVLQMLDEIRREVFHRHPEVKSVMLERVDRTLYEPYELQTDGSAAHMMADAVSHVYGPHITPAFTGDGSTSSFNLFARQGWRGFECGPDGGGAHEEVEYVWEAEIAKTIQLVRHFVSGKAFEGYDWKE